MTRIIAGYAGSLTLRVPKSGTRPTSDRVREAIFSALESRDAIHGATVLDLYAGSGALGLEAASRGASAVVLVERSAQAATVAKRNASAVTAAARSKAPSVTVVTQAVRSYLERGGVRAHLVFIDPPYELSEADLAADLEQLVPLLDADAVVVVERSSRTPEPSWPAGLAPERRKDYGETVVWWASPA
ncbi:16S rRNA (guanine(966)-N(2))-methyltransferase RsmD [Microbacteriaceae bacterium VKM Ac-2854]|nr:16S rRNA (guanine(966)-N(2))-methyltransferase RsmD [Microbacteriaceae bacterium VKM Ac-2854]